MTYDFPQLQAPILLEGGTFDAAAILPALAEEDRARVRGFAAGIDAGDPSGLAVYGAAEQGAMQTWLDIAIKTVADQGAKQDARSVDRILGSLRGFDRLCGARRFLVGHTSFARLRKEYARLAPAVDANANALLDQSIGLRRVSKVLERMEQENQAHLARLSTYLLCGEVRLQELRGAGAGELGRLERRLHDIALTRQVALQTRGQLLLLVDGNARMIDTMERTLGQTLPLWKAQVLVALGLSAQAEARAEVERTRRALERDMRARNSLLGRLMAALRGHKDERAALRQSNARLLDAVTDLQRALRAQEPPRLQANDNKVQEEARP